MNTLSKLNDNRLKHWQKFGGVLSVTLFFLLAGMLVAEGFAANLRVLGVAKDGSIGRISEYRWVIEEDITFDVDPNLAPPADIQAVNFHKSYMPLVAEGDNNIPLPTLDPAKKYFVSVIPKQPGTYSIGGAQLIGDGRVTVYLNALPIPTAQITIFVHEDLSPINSKFDTGEAGLEGFRIKVEDAGGRYGASAGEQSTDAYGNFLGTIYQSDCDVNGQNPGSGTGICLDTDGLPLPELDGNGLPVLEPLISGADGSITIKNLAPGKYGILAIPPNAVEDPPGSGIFVSTNWQQTSTIEGSKVIDAWVKADEPPFFQEFGAPGPHVSIGFVPASKNNPYVDTGFFTGPGSSISGRVVNLHLSRPPGTDFHLGAPFPHTTPWVGLNLGAAGLGQGVYAARTNEDGTFTIPDVPDGSYQLAVWDDNMDILFAFQTVIVNGTNVDLGDVGVFQWFARMEQFVFDDENENGFPDVGEEGIAEQATLIRWRDGSVYQEFPTDLEGMAPFDQVFPFFAWLVAEVDFARFKATGLTAIVDDGGPIDVNNPFSSEGNLTPQQQGVPADPDSAVVTANYRTELGPVLTQGFQTFLGQTSVLQWGKKPYGPGENGGISGIVYYAVTRAEDNPEFAGAEPWEPGIPRVTVNLYEYDAAQPSMMGALLATTTTDSWDDSLPENCQYGANAGSATDAPFVFRGQATDCYDGLRNWNQVRPGVFDGGYAFDSIIDPNTLNVVSPIPPGRYVVEVVPPQGYKIIKPEDRNVDFGDEFTAAPQLLPPECVGAPHTVPAELTLFPGVDAPFAGQTLAGCEAKLVSLTNGSNAAADFFLFTDTPIAAHIKGFILDDTANEFDPASPQFGEKYAPPYLPVAFRDYTGRMIASTYSDEYGTYNALVPSTLTNNLPQPSGISPNMITSCMNDPEADTLGNFYNPQYSTFCYTFQFMPGTTTYLDTPVVPTAAFAGPDQFPLDCQYPDGTPRIASVNTSDSTVGPYLVTDSGTITINSVGAAVAVPNPEYDGVGGTEPKTIFRDYGFGAAQGGGTAQIIENPYSATPTVHDLNVTSWNATTIVATVPGGVATGQLVVTRDNGIATQNSVTVQVGLRQRAAVREVSAGGSIQDAIDIARPNDLILVGPGTYEEILIMWKPVQLQGAGESTIIRATKTPTEKLDNWRTKVESLQPYYSFLTGQGAMIAGGIEPATLFSEEGSGVLVLATDDPASLYSYSQARNAGSRIDGLSITSGDTGGGIVLNGYANGISLTNNRIFGNSGFYAGGIRVGQPELFTTIANVDVYTDAMNDDVIIGNNYVSQNAGFDGAGGGVLICNGADNYLLNSNYICGNFTLRSGAGVAHYGFSDNGEISDNIIIFNENFNQGITVNGGGISVAGHPIVQGQTVTDGSGNVNITRNVIQGNSAGVGDGGGIHLARINGDDVVSNPGTSANWYTIDITNNMIVNNVAGLSGGGIFMQDAVQTNILFNTISGNDNTSTGSPAFTPGVPDQTNPQPGAGIASSVHSLEFAPVATAETLPDFSDPTISSNIIWENRMFYFLVNPAGGSGALCPDIGGLLGLGCGTAPVYDDLAVIPTTAGFTLTAPSVSAAGTNILTGLDADPSFVSEYKNANRAPTTQLPEPSTGIGVTVAFDEGGNFIRLRYGPLTQIDPGGGLFGDYHLTGGNGNGDAGVGVTIDIDGDARGGSPDSGADEF